MVTSRRLGASLREHAEPASQLGGLVQQFQALEPLAAAPAAMHGAGLGHQGIQQLPLRLVLGPTGASQGPHQLHREQRGPDGHQQEQSGHGPRQPCQRRVVPGPAPQPLPRRGPPRGDGQVGQESPQVVGHRLGRRIAVGGLGGHRLVHHGLQVRRHARCRHSQRRRAAGDLLHQPQPVGLVEGGPQRQHLVERGAQGVDVGPRVATAREPLRRQEAQCAHQLAGLRQLVGIAGLGQAEVGDP